MAAVGDNWAVLGDLVQVGRQVSHGQIDRPFYVSRLELVPFSYIERESAVYQGLSSPARVYHLSALDGLFAGDP